LEKKLDWGYCHQQYLEEFSSAQLRAAGWLLAAGHWPPQLAGGGGLKAIAQKVEVRPAASPIHKLTGATVTTNT